MKIVLKIGLETDGDYFLNNSEIYGMEFDGSGYYNTFEFTDSTSAYSFEDQSDIKFDAWWRACRLLEKMLCDIHVSYTHYYILEYLYHMFDDAINALGQRKKEFEVEVYGNYEGTFISFLAED